MSISGITRIARLATFIVVLAAILPSCGNSRPSWEMWDLTWATAQSAVPTAAALVASGEAGLCEAGLGQLRNIRGDLIPTPEPLLDETMSEWIDTAESALFACPPIDDEDYQTTFTQLDQIEAAIETLIAGR